MSYLGQAFLFLLALVLQKTVAPLFAIGDLKPNFLLIYVVSISFRHGRFWGLIVGFAGGLLDDMLGTKFVGLSSLTNCLAAYVAGVFGTEWLERRLLTLAGFLLAVLLAHDLVFYGVLALGTESSLWRAWGVVAIPSALYTLVFIVILHLVWPRIIWGRTI